MPLQEKLIEVMKEGMRSKNVAQVSVVRLLRATIKNKEIDKHAPLTDEEILQVISSAIKQRKESIEQFSKGGRQDLVDKESGEADILQSFLPPPLSEDELHMKIMSILAETGVSDVRQMGKVMKILMPQVVGRVDGSTLSQRVRSCLEKGIGMA